MLALILAAGCAPMRGSSDEIEPQPRSTVEVNNRSLTQMTIYVARDGHRIRLGQVQALTRATFVIPPHLISGLTQVHFVADPIGRARPAATTTITMQPGDHVALVIPR